jgi:hypothetical protein
MNPAIRAIGIAAYEREDYPRILGIMADGERLPRTYEQWRKGADDARRRIEAAGKIAVEVTLDPDAFALWCEARGLDINHHARGAFVTEAVARMHPTQ